MQIPFKRLYYATGSSRPTNAMHRILIIVISAHKSFFNHLSLIIPFFSYCVPAGSLINEDSLTYIEILF